MKPRCIDKISFILPTYAIIIFDLICGNELDTPQLAEANRREVI